jgi:hypothetical protein
MRVSFLSLAVIIGSLLFATAAVVLSLWLARRRRDLQLREHGKPVLVMPLSSMPEVPRAPMIRDAQPMRRSPITALAVAERLAPDDYSVVAGTHEDDLATVTTGQSLRTNEVAEMIQGRSLRFHRAVDASLHLLPGRLEVAEGADAGLELRFVRLSDGDEPVITFGRSEGPAYRHVQLLEPTVSRTHARMKFEENGWSLTNLSRTNPVSVNGAPLGDDVPYRLRDGDRVEMGTLIFRYRGR